MNIFITGAHILYDSVFCNLSLNIDLNTYKSHKIVSLIRQTYMKNYTTHEDEQYNTCASQEYYIIVLFICDSFFCTCPLGSFHIVYLCQGLFL